MRDLIIIKILENKNLKTIKKKCIKKLLNKWNNFQTI